MTTSPDDRMLIVRVYPPEHRIVRVIDALALRPREDVHGEKVSLRRIPFQASHMPKGIARSTACVSWTRWDTARVGEPFVRRSHMTENYLMILRRLSPRGQRTPLDSRENHDEASKRTCGMCTYGLLYRPWITKDDHTT